MTPTSLQFPKLFLYPFFEDGDNIRFSPVTGASSHHHDLLQLMETGLVRMSASSLSTRGCSTTGPTGVDKSRAYMKSTKNNSASVIPSTIQQLVQLCCLKVTYD